MNVLHSYSHWLPVTMNWLFNQIRFLPDDISSHIFCDEILNEMDFPVASIFSVKRNSMSPLILNKIIRKSGFSRWNFPLISQLKKHSVDVLHSHFGHTGWENMAVAEKSGVPHVVTFYGADVHYLPAQNPKWYGRYRQLFESADLFLCEGPHMQQELIKLGCPEQKTRVQHLGVAVDEIFFNPLLPKKGEAVRILIAASFREKKGIPYALQALQNCADCDFSVTVIGDAGNDRNSAAEKAAIMKLAETDELKSRITFLGFQPYERLREEMSRHHIFLSPSVTAADGDTEGGAPMGIIEACASGMFVISSTHCDIPNVVLHEETGLLAPEKDAEQLAAFIRGYINQKYPVLEMLKKSRQRVEDHFSAEIQGGKLAEIYRNVGIS